MSAICPSCGYQEPFDWKNSPHQLYMQYLNPEEALEFLVIHNNLAAELKENPKFAAEGYHAFRLTKKGYLHRQPKAHCHNNKWTNYSSCYQKYRKPTPISQTKLFTTSHAHKTVNPKP